MLNKYGQGGGLNAGLSLWLPLNDLGSGAVNTVPANSSGDGTATFTRATTATTILSTGLIGSVASGTARSCYSPAGVYLGYLAEEQRTNLCLQSADFTTTWTATALTVGGSVTLPDGTTGTKNKLQEDNTSTGHTDIQTFTKAASALAYTASVYLKQAERTWAQCLFFDGTNGVRFWFNLATGAIGSTSAIGTGWTAGSYSMVQAANGFWRCIFNATSSTSTTLQFRICPATGDAALENYTGTTGSGIYAWGAQLEQAAFATSYIPTTTATVTRNADVLTYPKAGNIDVTQGTLYAEIDLLTLTGTKVVLQGTVSEGAPMAVNGSGVLLEFDGTNSGSFGSALSVNAVHKCGTRWAGASMSGISDGGTINSGTFDGDMSIAGATLGVGTNATPGNYINGTIKNLKVWTRALADSQLVSLTS